MLALRGSGGIKAGEGQPPARAPASTEKVAVAAVPCVLAQKVSSALESGGPPPHRAAATATFFSQIAQGCSESETLSLEIVFSLQNQ